MSVYVIRPGMQTTVQSGPRIGLRHLGIPAAGAADPLSLALANRLVGNELLAPALEATLAGPHLQFDDDLQIAITGASANGMLNGVAVESHRTVDVGPGDELELVPGDFGCRSYIAFRGGLKADVVLGSASTYVPAAIGGHEGRALREGDVLDVTATGRPVPDGQTPARFRPPMTGQYALRACLSVESGLLVEKDRRALFDEAWTVSRRADRMGLALDGRPLSVYSDGRLPSAAAFPGTIQCPEDGTPILLSVDAQTTGGYPRVLQVTRADRHRLGQLRPGDHLRFLPREPEEAIAELRAMHDLWREWLPGIEAVI